MAVIAASAHHLAGLAEVVIGVQGLLAPEHREHLAKVTRAAMAANTLVVAEAAHLLPVVMHMASTIEMAAMEAMALHGAMEPPMPEAAVDTDRVRALMAAVAQAAVAVPALRVLQILAVAAGHTGNLAALALGSFVT
jgi:hypothetical protein